MVVVVAMNMRSLLLLIAVPAFAFVQEPPSVDGVSLPNADAGFGCYYTPGYFGAETLYLAAMRDHGLNYFAPQARLLPGEPEDKWAEKDGAARCIAREINNAALVGLLDCRFPLVCYKVGPADVIRAKDFRLPDVEWPELACQNSDEPNGRQVNWVRQCHEEAHAAGLRDGTAVAGYQITGYYAELPWCDPKDVDTWERGLAEFLDIWIIGVGTWRDNIYKIAAKQGAMIGSYLAYPSSNILDRYTFGVYAWKMRSNVNLVWAAINKQATWDYSRIEEVSATEFKHEKLDGLLEGTIDYRVLQAVASLQTRKTDEWLKGVEDSVPFGWWPKGYVKDNQDKEIPTVDMDKVRTEGLALLKKAGYGK
jgi:hypothetical protein